MAILLSLACVATAPVAFAAPPWADDDPRRDELAQRLDPDHLARRIDQAVARLDLGALWQSYAGTGSRAHRPDLLLRVVLYETQRGQPNPAPWHREARESEPVRWLLRGCLPSRSCWYAFRDRLAPLLDACNRQVLHQAVEEGLTPARRGAEDGTVVAAHASRHKMVNAATLDKHALEVATAVAADEHGTAPAVVPGWMARTPAGRQTQQGRLKQAQGRLEQLQLRNRTKRSSKRKPADKVLVSVSDPEAAVGRDKEKVYRPLYNVPGVDDLDSPFVLGYQVLAQQNDAGRLETMLPRLKDLLGQGLDTLLADTAYAGGADLAAAQRHGVKRYAPLPADSQKKEKPLPKSPFRWLDAEQT